MRPGDEPAEGDRGRAEPRTARQPSMTSETPGMSGDIPSTPLGDTLRSGVREASGVWWWYLILGVAWIWYGMFVLSYRVGSLAAVAALVGVAFLFGGVAQLVGAGRVETWRWLYIVSGILGVAAGIMTFVWPDITLYVVS